MSRVALVTLAAVLAVGWGCRQSPSVDPAATAAPSPEEAFAVIAETFRRGIEDIPIGFVVQEAGGHSMLTGKNTVSYELISPESDAQPYRAVITVDSQSSYSIQRSSSAENTAETDEAAARGNGFLEDSPVLDGIDILDADLISTPRGRDGSARKGQDVPEPRVARQPDRLVREFELVHENDTWVLVTEIDSEKEQTIQNAFDRALSTQPQY